MYRMAHRFGSHLRVGVRRRLPLCVVADCARGHRGLVADRSSMRVVERSYVCNHRMDRCAGGRSSAPCSRSSNCGAIRCRPWPRSASAQGRHQTRDRLLGRGVRGPVQGAHGSHHVVVATPNGVVPNLDMMSLRPEMAGRARITLALECVIRTVEEIRRPIQLSDARLEDYDAVHLPGGHGPMEDLWLNADVGRLLTAALALGQTARRRLPRPGRDSGGATAEGVAVGGRRPRKASRLACPPIRGSSGADAAMSGRRAESDECRRPPGVEYLPQAFADGLGPLAGLRARLPNTHLETLPQRRRLRTGQPRSPRTVGAVAAAHRSAGSGPIRCALRHRQGSRPLGDPESTGPFMLGRPVVEESARWAPRSRDGSPFQPTG